MNNPPGHRLPFCHRFRRHLLARPRLLIVTALGCLLFFLLPPHWHRAARGLIAWDSGVALYLVLVISMMARSGMEQMQRRAELQDEGQNVMLALTVIAALASLAAIIAELVTAKGLTGHMEWQHISLAAITVLLSWTFMQTIFALHYAHEYYGDEGGAPARGLDFPGTAIPLYWDFIYFSFVIGTASQTADVNITAPGLRKIVTLHCVAAFFFNTTILALTVNIGAGLT